MKTVFIVNPKAGKKKNIENFIEKIRITAEKIKCDVEIYKTRAVGDATTFVRDFCEKHGKTRFVACGGDGTLGEVVNGVMEFPGCEVGVVPMGTGNDFCRNFECDFSDLQGQINGASEKCDVIHYSTFVDGKEKTGYCMNMFNIGFDCNVADLTNVIKSRSFIGGSFAYFLSILINLVKKKGANLKIEVDGKEMHDGPLLLNSIANGCYCGGGIKSNPLANIRDGHININVIKNVSRILFISLLPAYMKGKILEMKRAKNIIDSVNCEKIKITPYSGKMRICIDGEITDAGEIEFQVVHKGINLVVPQISVKEEALV